MPSWPVPPKRSGRTFSRKWSTIETGERAIPSPFPFSFRGNDDHMNYFAHGRPFLDQPYFLAGTAVPDWLNVVDRKCRARSKKALPLCESSDAMEAQVAAGIVQHHADDDWFHRTEEFNRLQWDFTKRIRDFLGKDSGLRPSFLGHILVELLLDSALIEDDPDELDAYYAALKEVDGALVQQTVQRIAERPAERLDWFIGRFVEVRFLEDYPDDEKLLYRLNQVMQRVKLPALPDAFATLLPELRRDVRASSAVLLTAHST
ncbi:hypothetical protein Pan97_48510 [Bremerella volcania]|uniref:Uncharacterized protein n=2 Tax=Bremerella volcania TaxID=2527984 RepID=A0A518CEW4_9BACT|nr:hypothetical protein Pan97_48510 [Bremerella volcania]